jgi:pyroglutamyl-peptidase
MATRERILVTGYGPFRQFQVNPSWEAVRKLPETIEGFPVETLLLPVDYDQVTRTVPGLIKHRALVVHVGVGENNWLKLETLAHNSGYDKGDINGNTPPLHRAVDWDTHEPIKTLVPVDSVVSHCSSLGWKIRRSVDAGRFLCEFVFATSMYHLEQSQENVPCVFVHVPPVGHPYTQEELDCALRDIVQCLVRTCLLSDESQH